jgi:signal transduction histidine kinase
MRLPRWVTDVVITLIVGASSIGEAINQRSWSTLPICVAGTVAIFFRRRWPLRVLAIATVGTAAVLVLGGDWLAASVLFAVYTVASVIGRPVSLRATIIVAAALIVPTLYDKHWNATSLIGPLILISIAWLFGDNMNARDREREDKVQRAAADERARIARELHDVVTHNVSVMVVQAAAANEIFDHSPERAREAIAAVEETGRRALNELRRLLGVVASDEAGILPQPSLDRLDELVDRVRATGLEVQLVVEGTPGDVPEGVGLSAYRIVQESLTNTIKHAFASHVTVRVRHSPGAVEVEVTDDGVGALVPSEGRGLIGMRERVALFGGELDAGSRTDGGFGVRARIPVAAA